ncbi:MAG: Uma2 family endonuclease [Armatimonadetes bacterium]|nr:Uma2 family endonuclease [Armatimonadota bacterium]
MAKVLSRPKSIVRGGNTRKFTRAELERMYDAGILHPDETIELIGGELVAKELPMKSAHATAIRLCVRALQKAFPEEAGYLVDTQLPLALSERDLPLPDVAVVEGSIRDFAYAHPTRAVLVVEVSEATLRLDRHTKASLYAWAGIPEYWIVNLMEGVQEVFREPAPIAGRPYGYGYRQQAVYQAGESITPVAQPEAVIAVDDLLPPRETG